MLRCLTHPAERRGIHRELNKHESVHALEDAIFYGKNAAAASTHSTARALRPRRSRSTPPRS